MPLTLGDTFLDEKDHPCVVISSWFEGVVEFQEGAGRKDSGVFFPYGDIESYNQDYAREAKAAVYINLTTDRELVTYDKTDEPACIIQPENTSHPRINNQSYVFYGGADFFTKQSCKRRTECGEKSWKDCYKPIIPMENHPIEDRILNKIHQNAKEAKTLIKKWRDILIKQGHIQ